MSRDGYVDISLRVIVTLILIVIFNLSCVVLVNIGSGSPTIDSDTSVDSLSVKVDSLKFLNGKEVSK